MSKTRRPTLPLPSPKSISIPFYPPSDLMAIDCEMVETKGGRDEVAHVSVVSRSGVLYDKYVRPEGEITDYRTAFSGITPEIIRNCTNGGDPPFFSHRLCHRPARSLCGNYKKTHYSRRSFAGE